MTNGLDSLKIMELIIRFNKHPILHLGIKLGVCSLACVLGGYTYAWNRDGISLSQIKV